MNGTSKSSTLTLAEVLPALASKVSLSPRGSAGQTEDGTSQLLKYLLENHGKALPNVVCVDLTVYEYGLESLPLFHLVATRTTADAYMRVVQQLSQPVGPDSKKSYSIAINPEFLNEDSLHIIEIDSRATERKPGTEMDARMTQGHYPLREYSPYKYECPPLTESLQQFKKLLEENSHHLRAPSGAALAAMICCNFRAFERTSPEGFRTLGQIFVGIAPALIGPRVNAELDNDVKRLLNDLGCLLYRTSAADLFLKRGQNQAIDTFAHEAKQLVHLVKGWPQTLDTFFDTVDGVTPAYALKPTLRSEISSADVRAIALPDYFDTALSQMLLWTMADSVADLPFGQDPSEPQMALPKTLAELIASCFEAARRHVLLTFAKKSRVMRKDPLAIRALERYLAPLLPRLEVVLPPTLPTLAWEGEYANRLVDFSRLLIVAFREALQHGKWGGDAPIRCTVAHERDSLDLTIENDRWDDKHVTELFVDVPSTLPLSRDDLAKARFEMHSKSGTYSVVGSQGRRQMSFHAERAGGRLDRSDVAKTRNDVWCVECSFTTRALFRGEKS